MNRNEIQQPAIRFEVPAIPSLPTETTDGFCRLRDWQERCYKSLKDVKNWIIKAPMASGKSFEICAIAADSLRRDQSLKVLIAVPQTIIAAGFRHNKIEFPDSTRVEWAVNPSHDFCREALKDSTANLLQFLLDSECRTMMDRVVLCTHATLTKHITSGIVVARNWKSSLTIRWVGWCGIL
jgi:hypothetical protein